MFGEQNNFFTTSIYRILTKTLMEFGGSASSNEVSLSVLTTISTGSGHLFYFLEMACTSCMKRWAEIDETGQIYPSKVK